jgi:predicted dehydrogenase
METSHKITLLGTGLIGRFYTMTLHGKRGRDRIHTICAVPEEAARRFAGEFGIPKWTADMAEAIRDRETDTVVIGIPNDLHHQAVLLSAEAGKAVLCTKPLGRNAAEARSMLEAVERAGVFAGYLEDLCYTPKTLKSLVSVRQGSLGQVLWARSREAHPGPHSAWFWDIQRAGGGAIVDLGCHCIEILRNFIGKEIRPVEVLCTADTLVHPIEAEDSAIGLIRFANKAIGQFEVSWTFRGGMDLRDEVAGTEGTLWLNHFLRTGFEMFTAARGTGYVAEKAEGETGWLFPVGDEVHELGYADMFADMFDSMDRGGRPSETFYDGYVVNAIIDACYRSARSKRWEKVDLFEWRGKEDVQEISGLKSYDDNHFLIKEERMPDGTTKLILKERTTGEIRERLLVPQLKFPT